MYPEQDQPPPDVPQPSTRERQRSRKRKAPDHQYAMPSSPKALKAKLDAAIATVCKMWREKSNALARVRRAKKNMKALLEELKAKNLINEELNDKLECYSDLPVHLLSRQGAEYTQAQRDFALTLHLHGPKAYHYLRDDLKIHLPHPSSLKRWLISLDAKPGLNKMMLDMLGKRRQEDEAKYGVVTLMLDAMAIKKHVQYDPQSQTMSGFVDMGDRINQSDIASEALVFLVVGLQGYWKAPIGYYLTKSLTPETQSVLVVHALEELNQRQIKVVCMTMDGHASNISMCTQLGCDLKATPCEPLKTHFPHPRTRDKVFVMMDACHMLKLTRNMLEAYSPILSVTGTINWKYIVHLNDVQKKSGLHAANRVTDKHVYFGNQKMKVSLAAQALSNSVAVALRTLRDLKEYAVFQDCEATAEFIEITDRLFDILNSRNPRARGFKAPLGSWNWKSTREFLSRARAYLLALRMGDGTPLYRTKRSLKKRECSVGDALITLRCSVVLLFALSS